MHCGSPISWISLDRLAGLPSELGRGVAQHMQPRGRQPGQNEVAAEAPVEGATADAPWVRSSLPERLILTRSGGSEQPVRRGDHAVWTMDFLVLSAFRGP